MSRERFLVTVLLSVLAWAGCRGGPVSMTVQRGSSIMVAVDTNPSMTGDLPKIGYGTLERPDVQRGRLDFFIGSASNPLTLRSTSMASPAPSSPIARFTTTTDLGVSLDHPNQVVSLLDIPETAPLGQGTLKVRHVPYVPPGQTETPGPTRTIGTIWILPAELTFTDGGTTYNVSGTYTPIGSHGLIVDDSNADRTIPDPQLIIPLPATAHAVELGVAFPTGLAQVVDAGEFRTDRTTDLAWAYVVPCSGGFQSCLDVTHTIKVVAVHGSGIQKISLVFQLSGTTRVNPAAITVHTFLARDEFGNEIPALPEGNHFCVECTLDAATFVVR